MFVQHDANLDGRVRGDEATKLMKACCLRVRLSLSLSISGLDLLRCFYVETASFVRVRARLRFQAIEDCAPGSLTQSTPQRKARGLFPSREDGS